jgi:hypothetical protein
VTGCAGAMRAIAPSIPPHIFPRQSHRKPAPTFYAAGTGAVTTVQTCVSGSALAAKLRQTALTHRRHNATRVNLPCAEKAGNIYTVPLYIYRVFLLLLNAFPRQGRRRAMPRFRAAGAGGVTTVETCVSGGAPAAKLRTATQTRRRYIAARVKMPLCT